MLNKYILKSKLTKTILSGFILSAAISLQADSVFMRNGQALHGKIVNQTRTIVKIEVNGEIKTLEKADIQRIQYGPTPQELENERLKNEKNKQEAEKQKRLEEAKKQLELEEQKKADELRIKQEEKEKRRLEKAAEREKIRAEKAYLREKHYLNLGFSSGTSKGDSFSKTFAESTAIFSLTEDNFPTLTNWEGETLVFHDYHADYRWKRISLKADLFDQKSSPSYFDSFMNQGRNAGQETLTVGNFRYSNYNGNNFKLGFLSYFNKYMDVIPYAGYGSSTFTSQLSEVSYFSASLPTVQKPQMPGYRIEDSRIKFSKRGGLAGINFLFRAGKRFEIGIEAESKQFNGSFSTTETSVRMDAASFKPFNASNNVISGNTTIMGTEATVTGKYLLPYYGLSVFLKMQTENYKITLDSLSSTPFEYDFNTNGQRANDPSGIIGPMIIGPMLIHPTEKLSTFALGMDKRFDFK